ncbi:MULTISPECIES: DUF4199 domain-containing protein [Flammeovirga]|uniref:DUF4199 domain-containing protein n=1 Tax=Flammeovirga agarivorans TaxID=2726742 RepID=A0A7X8SML6_9BACT|nr:MULTISPECIES: DUF4199 domain-containing protein [Flammeovirga]NLR92963.1 DUF4199 domain-containing protein [Flammeovirga agarivorans]
MNELPQKRTFAIKYGAIVGVFSFGYSVLLSTLGKTQDPFLQYLNILVIVTATFFAYREYKFHSGGYLNYKDGVKLGTLLSFIGALITGVLNYLYVKFLDDSAIMQAIEQTRVELEKQPQLTDEQIDQAIELSQWLALTPIPYLLSVVLYTFLGFLLALAISYFMKQEVGKDGYNF